MAKIYKAEMGKRISLSKDTLKQVMTTEMRGESFDKFRELSKQKDATKNTYDVDVQAVSGKKGLRIIGIVRPAGSEILGYVVYKNMRNFKNYIRIIALMLVTMVCLSGCGNSYDNYNYVDSYYETDSFNKGIIVDMAVSNTAEASSSFGFSNNKNTNSTTTNSYESSYEQDIEHNNTIDNSNAKMLVYSGSIEIRTYDYNNAVTKLEELLKEYDCFFEYCTEYVNNNWYNGEQRELMNYKARIRVPAKNYDAMMSSIADIDKVTNKSSNVDNLTVEYNEIKTSIDILEAKRERYLTLLAQAHEDSYAISIEQYLTDVEIQLARLKTRANTIQTDVEYSYIDVKITEAAKYSQEVEHDDPFFTRLWKHIVNTFFGFIDFLEKLLFFLIGILPYCIIFIPAFILIRKLFRKWKEHKAERKNRKKDKYIFRKSKEDIPTYQVEHNQDENN